MNLHKEKNVAKGILSKGNFVVKQKTCLTVVSALRSRLWSVCGCLCAVPIKIIIFAVIFYLNEATKIVAVKLVIPIEVAIEAVWS